MQRPSLTRNAFKRFATLSLLISPTMLIVGCGADPMEGDAAASPAVETEAPADGSGTTEAPPSGSGSK